MFEQAVLYAWSQGKLSLEEMVPTGTRTARLMGHMKTLHLACSGPLGAQQLCAHCASNHGVLKNTVPSIREHTRPCVLRAVGCSKNNVHTVRVAMHSNKLVDKTVPAAVHSASKHSASHALCSRYMHMFTRA